MALEGFTAICQVPNEHRGRRHYLHSILPSNHSSLLSSSPSPHLLFRLILFFVILCHQTPHPHPIPLPPLPPCIPHPPSPPPLPRPPLSSTCNALLALPRILFFPTIFPP